jgi:hypothetical protein
MLMAADRGGRRDERTRPNEEQVRFTTQADTASSC